jgi:hypothetical protein
MTAITEKEFEHICSQINEEREAIFRHNPIGTEEETLLWMLMSVLIGYLSLSEQETPCFPGAPTADTYRQAILFILQGRGDFEAEKYLDKLIKKK